MSSFDELWCGDCGKSHEGMCKKHGVLHKVQDAVIPSRARLTLPSSLTLKSVKENGSVHTAVFSKRVIPVRSQFGPFDAPILSKSKLEVKQKKETTVWKKKNAMQKSMETSTLTQNGDNSDVNQSSNDLQSPIIASVRSLQTKSNNSIGNDVAISSIPQQLMSVNNQSISQSGMGDGGLLNLQGGLNQLPLHSSPIHNHASLNQLQHSLQDLQSIGFPSTPNSIQLTQENLHSLAQQYPSYGGHPDFSSVQQHLNFADFVSATQLQHSVGADQSGGSLLLGPPIEADGQSTEDSGVGDTSNVNVSDSTATDATSDTELEDSMEQDMSFEFKVLTDDGCAELYDTTDEDHSNWMIFVRPATSVKEQNLIAYQEDGQIYFVSLKPIQTNTELKVWYSKDYAKSINKGMLSTEPVIRQFDDNKLQCLQCEVKFSDQEEMENHFCVSKIKARRKGRPRKYVKPTKTWRAKMEKTKVKESQQGLEAKANIDISMNADTNVTSPPVKRGRGRPRTKASIVKNEEQFVKTEHNVILVPVQHTVQPMHHQKPLQQSQQQPQHHTNQQQFQLEIDNPYHILPDDDNDEDVDDSHNDIEDQSYANNDDDPLFEEKKLVITEDRPKKKRGPKSSKAPTPCPHCGESFQAEAAYYLHVYSHTGIKPFICDVEGCERGFLSKFKLERHRLIHTSPRHHKCSYCDKSFNRKDHLKNHMITHDPHKKIWKCELCGKEYSYSFSYRTHMAFHAADRGETLSCGICKKNYENKEQLLFHLKVHTGARAAKNATEKTHQCFECSKKFFTRKDVKRHMITHTKKKDFLCQFCPQRFGRKDHLTRHLRTTHTGDNQTSGRQRRSTGDSTTASPSKQKRERQIYTQIEPTMVPLQMAIPTMQPDDLQEQLMSSVAAASQSGNMSATSATILQNLQYAISQTPGNHGAARDIQIPAVLYEAAAAASAQQQQEQQQQQHHQQQEAQANQIAAAASMNSIQPPPGMPTVQHSTLPMQYQINEKGYVLHNSQPEQTIVRQIQVSPNVEYKHIAQQLQSNMFITAVSNPSNLQHHHHQQQQQQQQQVQHIQLQQTQPQQHQTMLSVGKIETQAIELTRANGLAAALQQPPEYQIATAQPVANMGQSNVSVSDQNNQTQLLMANPVDSRLLSYMETLRFLENLPTNNTGTIPLQQLQALNVDISQGQTAQIIPAVPAGAYNSVSGGNILNLNQAEFKGVVTIQHPHGATAVQLTPQDIKNVVSLAHTVTPVQHVTYQQQS